MSNRSNFASLSSISLCNIWGLQHSTSLRSPLYQIPLITVGLEGSVYLTIRIWFLDQYG